MRGIAQSDRRGWRRGASFLSPRPFCLSQKEGERDAEASSFPPAIYDVELRLHTLAFYFAGFSSHAGASRRECEGEGEAGLISSCSSSCTCQWRFHHGSFSDAGNSGNACVSLSVDALFAGKSHKEKHAFCAYIFLLFS